MRRDNRPRTDPVGLRLLLTDLLLFPLFLGIFWVFYDGGKFGLMEKGAPRVLAFAVVRCLGCEVGQEKTDTQSHRRFPPKTLLDLDVVGYPAFPTLADEGRREGSSLKSWLIGFSGLMMNHSSTAGLGLSLGNGAFGCSHLFPVHGPLILRDIRLDMQLDDR
jgi:hypothetical protein